MSDYSPDSVDNHPDSYKPDDDGTMPDSVNALAEKVIGHRIVSAERGEWTRSYRDCYDQREGIVLTLDDGTRVRLADTSDCCAYTQVEKFLLHPERVDHIITGVATTEGYTKWHIYADLGDVLELDVGWSCGNPFYYGYGFDISVIPTGTP
jgi:hypothetical protein